MSERAHATGSSLTDLMASLVAIFALLFVAAQNNRGVGIETARAELIKQLKGELQQAGIDSMNINADPKDPNSIVIIFPDSVLFPRGSSSMLPEGRRVVRHAIPRLADLLCEGTRDWGMDQVIIEGHTDSTTPRAMTPERGRRYNLALSQRRAMDFVSQSIDTLVLGQGPLDCFLPLISATGRGQEQPQEGIPKDAAAQRRVVLRLRLGDERADSLRFGASSVDR